MSDEGSVSCLLMQLRAENPETRNRAASELIHRYTSELLTLITGRMRQRLQRRVAPEDILQDVLFSFCKRLGEGEYDLKNRNQFLKLIVTISLNKVCSASRRELRQRRDVRREQSLDSLDEASRVPFELADRGALAPEVVAEITEETEALLARLPQECREVLLLKVEGYATEEIAHKIDRSTRTVERRLERVRELWGEGKFES